MSSGGPGGAWEFAAARMAAGLLASGTLVTRRYGPGFALVPRHLFGVPVTGERDPMALVAGPGPLGAAYFDVELDARLPKGSSSPSSRVPAPSTLACLIEVLEPPSGSRVNEIGGGTGWSAAVLSVITGRRVRSVEIDPTVARAAGAYLRQAGFGERVGLVAGDGYFGHPAASAYDRILISATVAGLAPAWLGQLAPDGQIVAPLALGGRALVLRIRRGEDSEIRAQAHAVLDLPPATGPLAPSPAAPLEVPDLSGWERGEPLPEDLHPSRPDGGYLDAWMYMALKHPRHSTALAVDGQGGPVRVAALLDPADGSAAALTAGHIRWRGPGGPALAARASTVLAAWQRAGRPPLSALRCGWRFADPDADTPLLVPTRWTYHP